LGSLANCYITHIDKKAFLAAFLAVYGNAFSSSNIKSSFRATGLVPMDLEMVLSKLEAKSRTPTPPLPTTTLLEPKTPSNALEIAAQSTLILNRIRSYKSPTPESVFEIMQQFKNRAEMILHSQALMAVRIADLKAANQAAFERRKRKRKRTQKGATLSQAEAEDIVARRDAVALADKKRYEERQQAGGSSRGIRRCKACSNLGHNKRTCKSDTAASGN
jgi:hypothetical protein